MRNIEPKNMNRMQTNKNIKKSVRKLKNEEPPVQKNGAKKALVSNIEYCV